MSETEKTLSELREAARRAYAAEFPVVVARTAHAQGFSRADVTKCFGGREVRLAGPHLYVDGELVAERWPTISRREAGDALARYALVELQMHPVTMQTALREARTRLPLAAQIYDATER
jgi:hypothetical protein